MSPISRFLNALFILTVLIWSCAGVTHAAEPVLNVATTTTVFADMIRNVGGDRIAVTSIVPPGVDPHVFEPTSREARHVATANVLFINGLGLEEWLDKLLSNVSAPNLSVVTLSEGLTPMGGVSFSAHHHDSEGDPHFWLDVSHAISYVRRIEQALSEHDPAGADVYHTRASAYVAELEVLDQWIYDQLQTIPVAQRVLLSYHDAFGYMAQRYGLQPVGVVVRNPDREPSPRDLATLVRDIRRLGVKALFAEPQINPRLAQTLSQEAGIAVGILYSDALTAEVPTYIDMMRFNARSLVEALQ